MIFKEHPLRNSFYKMNRNFVLFVTLLLVNISAHAQSVITIKEAITILDQSIVKDYEMLGYKNPQTISSILSKYGYQTKRDYDVYRFTDYSYLYYKNCSIPALMDSGQYPYTPRPLRNGVACWVGVDGYAITITVFSQSVFNSLKNQIKGAGFEFISTEYDGEHYNNGAYDLVCTSIHQKDYFVTISKQY